MAQNETWLNHDLLDAVKVQYLDGNLFSMDNAGNLIGVKLTRDGIDYSGGGSVSANVIRADGGTVSVVGALSGNTATVVLPQAAYAVPGVVSIVVKLTVSGEVTTIAAVVANVYQSSTDAPIDPGTIIPSVQTLIAAIDAAVASIPADYSALWTSLAPAFSSSVNYTAGQYVTYNGALYRFTVDHNAGAWNSAHVTATNIGSDLTALKSALKQGIDFMEFVAGKYINTSGTTIDVSTMIPNASKKCIAVQCSAGDIFTINAQTSGLNLWFVDSNGGKLYYYEDSSATEIINRIVTAPINSAYLVINKSINDNLPCYIGNTVFNKEEWNSETIENTNNIIPVTFMYGYYIVTNTTNPNIDTPVWDYKFKCKCAVIPCAENDVFTVNGKKISNQTRLYAFLRSDKSLIEQSIIDEGNNTTVIAPAESAYFIINNDITSENKQSYIGGIQWRYIDEKLNNEITNRQTVEQQITTDINSEITNRQNADTAINSALSTEKNERISGDNNIVADINSESLARQSADSELLSEISEEESARIAADNLLGNGKVSKPSSNPNGVSGQVLRTNGDGTTTWVDVGTPTEAQTKEAVSEWLTNHPEATTTVQDNSLTYPKVKEDAFHFVIPANNGDVDTASAEDLVDATEKSRNVMFGIVDGGSSTGEIEMKLLESNYNLLFTDIEGTGYGLMVGDNATQQGTKNVNVAFNRIKSAKGNRARNPDVDNGNVMYLFNQIETTGMSGDDVGIELWSKCAKVIGNNITKDGRVGFSGITMAFGKSIASENYIEGFSAGYEPASDKSIVANSIINGSVNGIFLGSPVIDDLTVEGCVFIDVDTAVSSSGGAYRLEVNGCKFIRTNANGTILYQRTGSGSGGNIIRFNNCHFHNFNSYDASTGNVEFNNCLFTFDVPAIINFNNSVILRGCTINGAVSVRSETIIESCRFKNYTGLRNGTPITKGSGSDPKLWINNCIFDSPTDGEAIVSRAGAEYSIYNGFVINNTFITFNKTAEEIVELNKYISMVGASNVPVIIRDAYLNTSYYSIKGVLYPLLQN